jgi:hypothetical protein
MDPMDEADAIFDIKRPEPDTTITTIRGYIFTRLAKTVLVNELGRFEAGRINVKFPEVYAARIRKALALITDDLRATLIFMRDNNIRVSKEPVLNKDNDVQYEYWHNGRTGITGGAPVVLKKEVGRYVHYYFGEAVEENTQNER